ncbi:hypothetical protein BH09ACT12_BH09ACT12_21490 [soil metagenome]
MQRPRSSTGLVVLTLIAPLLALGLTMGTAAPADAARRVCPKKSDLGVCWTYQKSHRTLVFFGGANGYIATIYKGPKEGASRTVQADERARITFNKRACHKTVAMNFSYPGKYGEGYRIKLGCSQTPPR